MVPAKIPLKNLSLIYLDPSGRPVNRIPWLRRLHHRLERLASTGKVQISSFRDRSIAARFAELLTSDNSHPWSFEVGPPRVIGGQ